MADRWLTADEKRRIYELRHVHKLSQGKIAKVIGEESEDNHIPNRSTISRVLKTMPEPAEIDAPWEWELMEDFNLPWEASHLLANCWMLWTYWESNKTYPRPFTYRLAKWCYRIWCLVAEINPLKTADLLSYSRDYAYGEMAREVLGEDVDRSAHTAFLMIQPEFSGHFDSDTGEPLGLDPELDAGRCRIYHHLVDSGTIPPIPFGKNMSEYWTRESRLYPEDEDQKAMLEGPDKAKQEQRPAEGIDRKSGEHRVGVRDILSSDEVIDIAAIRRERLAQESAYLNPYY